MPEVLEGVFSETLLDEIAEDLGIEPGVLRNSPFFRVIKGRVLLTYPLKVFSLKQYQYAELLAHSAYFIPPNGTIVMVATISGITAANQLRLNHGIMRVASNEYVDGPAHMGLFGAIYCDGTNVKFQNNVGTEQTLYLEGVSLEL